MTLGWSKTPIGSVCDVIAGQSPPGDAYNDQADGLPFYQGKREFTDRYLASPSVWTTHVTKRALAGDILMSVRAPVGPVNEAREEVCIGRGLAAIRSGRNIERDYLWYALSWLQPEIAGNDGAVFPSINKAQIEALEIPLPPLNEQKRIAAALDQAFVALDRARVNAEANLADAQEVYSAKLQSIFAEIEGCRELGSLCDVFTDGDWIESNDQSSDGVRLIQTGNVGIGVFKDREEKARHISEDTFKRLRCTEIFEGDCLISRLPDPVGRSCILPSTGKKMITAVDCTVVRFNTGLMLPTFFNHYAQSSRYFDFVSQKCTGTTRNRISRSNLALVPVPSPPISKQRAVVSTLDKMRDEVLSLRDCYTQKLTDIAGLRQSFLQAAFSGQLG